MTTPLSTGYALPRRLLASAWFATAAVVGAIGWVLSGLSERMADRLSGYGLLAAAAVGLAVGLRFLRTGTMAGRLSLLASGLLVVVGSASATSALTAPRVFRADVIAQGVVPVAAGVVTGLLAVVLLSRRRLDPYD